jgi:hypothetical protein
MPAPPRRTETADGASGLRELTRRIAREMRVAAAIADDCQDAIDWDDHGALSHETVTRLQGLDMLSQQHVELGRVLDRLADEGLATGAVPGGLLEGVRLGDLKRRLEGGAEAGVAGPEVW